MSESPVPYEIPDERVRGAWARLMSEYLVTEGLEAAFARRIRADSPEWFAELGAATGPISHLLEPDGIRCVAFDLNPPSGAFSPMVCADLRQLPLPTARFDAVSAVNCLYFLDDPSVGVREAHRVLRSGGLFLASAPSRYHDPELRHVLPDWGERSPFDAEEVAEIVAGSFEDVVVEPWEEPAYYLCDQAAVTDYLVAFKIPILANAQRSWRPRHMSPSLESTCGPGVENIASRNVSKMSARPEVEARTVGAIPLLDEGTGVYGISSYRDTNPTLVRTLIDSIQAVLDD